jgi:c-di-GMP-binding flagellar brake protein YcgR
MAEQTILFDTGHANTLLATERRAWVRIRSEESIHYQHEEANTTWLGRVHDISLGGVAFVAPRRFEPGTALRIQLATRAGGTYNLVVRVIHATQQIDDRWVIGCAFPEPLSQQQLQDFIEPR